MERFRRLGDEWKRPVRLIVLRLIRGLLMMVVAPRTYSIAENSETGVTVGTNSATDPEGGRFTWSILSGNTDGGGLTSTANITINLTDVLETKF